MKIGDLRKALDAIERHGVTDVHFDYDVVDAATPIHSLPQEQRDELRAMGWCVHQGLDGVFWGECLDRS